AAGHRGLDGARSGAARPRCADGAATSEARQLRPRAHPDQLLEGPAGTLSRPLHGRTQPRGCIAGCRARRSAVRAAGGREGVFMSASTEVRGRKDLACTAEATAFQKAFGAELRERVVERGEPFAVAQADTPHEIFHAMDIPIVSNQWWSAYI